MKGVKGAATFAEWFEGFGGVSKDGLFGVPSWVDSSKPAGYTSQADQCNGSKTLKNMLNLTYFFFSPNLVWFGMSVLLYVVFPYDMEAAARGFAWGWVSWRLAVNMAVGLVYYGFFYLALYVGKWSKRKFRPGSYPTVGNMAHNLWYWTLGILHWSLAECAMTRLWATGRVPYVSGSELLASPWQWAALCLWVLITPLWREHHFYAAHRFIHVRALYKYVHALHHRNTDPEPFSGICMHPVEHLLYFSNALIPTLYVRCSPLVFHWIYLHAALSPGAGHSGWEDHWQADQYHYVHHAKFECNYGSGGTGWLDQLCGTFREKLGKSDAYTGEGVDKKDDKDEKVTEEKKVWSAQGYLGMQTGDHAAYSVFCLFTTLFLLWAAVLNARSASPLTAILGIPVPQLAAALVAYGPLAAALALAARYDKMNWRWPFHNERVFGTFGFFVLAGWLACILPTYHFVLYSCAL